MKTKKNSNDHKRTTPATEGERSNDRRFTSYDTSRKETSTPQKVRETKESPAEQARANKSKKR